MRDRENENLSVILAGFIPPNPAELIAGEATARFMEEVSKKFDIVIIDTPPIGVVADALLLTSYADVNIITVRHNTTPKPVLRMNLMDEKVKNIPHLSVLLNGIPSQSREYNYKYSYGNGKYFADAK
jgi:Mrp family chromosome partitioning ATPase